MEEMGLKPIRWVWSHSDEINDPVFVDAVRGNDGIKYAIRRNGECMDKDGEWDYEPMASERGRDFVASHRFDTMAEVVRVLQENCLDD